MNKKRRNNSVYGNLPPTEREFVKLYSLEELQVLKSKPIEALEEVVSETSANIVRVKRELEANSEFQRAMEILKPLREGYREAVKWQDCKRRLALSLLHKHGKVDIGDLEDDL